MFKYREKIRELYTKSDIEVLIATMHQENLEFLDTMFPFSYKDQFSILIINQTQSKTISSSNPKIRVINSSEIGLSKSRNLALKNAVGKLCVIADDDIVFLPDFADKILAGFTQFKDASCIQFCSLKSNEIPLKKYPTSPIKNLSWLELLSVFSIEMVIKKESLKANLLFFNENFGLGAPFTMGEEQVFLGRLKKLKLQVSYFPEYINKHETPSTVEKVTLNKRYYAQGALTYCLFGKYALFWVLLKIIFEVKQKTLKLGEIQKAFMAAQEGKTMFKKIKK